MKWTRRKGTTAKPTIAPGLIKEVGLTFYKDIAEIVQTLNIPPELIINIDQTPIPYILISKYSINQKKPMLTHVTILFVRIFFKIFLYKLSEILIHLKRKEKKIFDP